MKRILPVIHVVDKSQVLQNVEVCRNFGIKELFLISHNIGKHDWMGVLAMGSLIKNTYPDMNIGYNFLDLSIEKAIEVVREMDVISDYLWADTIGMVKPGDELRAIENYDVLKQPLPNSDFKQFDIQLFGGVEFKYQKPVKVEDREWLYSNVLKCTDIVTTSGERTGSAPQMDKLRRIKEAIGDASLAIASGVDKDNIKAMSEYVDYFLVSSSITDPSSELIIEKELEQLLNALK